MRKLLLLPLLLMLVGCAQHHFNVPPDNFATRVKTLGVVPIITDAGSEIRYPDREKLVALTTEMNRRNEQQLVRKLKATGNFYMVAMLDSEPQAFFANMLFRREKRDDATIQYNKYFWKTDELRNYLRRNSLDAVMIVVVSGLNKVDKISSSTFLKSLTAEYSYLIMTAQILDANGTILWEYPNFRSRFLSFDPLIALQYPDFNEADANMASAINVKYKSIEGLRRGFDKKRKDILQRETQENEIYANQFDEMISLLKYDADKYNNEPVYKTDPQRAPYEQPQPRSEQPAMNNTVPPAASPASTAPAAYSPAPESIAPAAPAPAAPATSAPATSSAPVGTVKPLNAETLPPATGKVY